MARRGSRPSRDYNRGMEDMRRMMEAEMREMEDKLRTAAKLMVLKERESWRSDRQQLLNENRTLQRNVSATEEANRTLESDLIKARETTGRVEEEINSLNHQLSAFKEKHDTHRLILWRELKKERQRAEVETKKRDEMIVSLQQSLNAQKVDTKRMGTPPDASSWQDKVTKLEALLTEKDKEISRATEKRRARTRAHVDTLALLNETTSALKESKLSSDSLEKNLRQQLSEKEERYQRELSEMKETFQKELSETVQQSRKELSMLQESWERRAQQWEKQQKELEETLLFKQKTWIHEEAERKDEIRRLTEKNLQLQELMTEEKQKWSVWSYRYKE